MIGFVALGIVAAAVIVVLWKRAAVKQELDVILNDLESTVGKLETFVAEKEVQITDHLEEIALHNRHVNLKSADQERAKRIQAKLSELLS